MIPELNFFWLEPKTVGKKKGFSFFVVFPRFSSEWDGNSIFVSDEFKPASIDKNQPGSLHKNKENRVTVEFHNNQQGKPKVSFEGSSEDYKENDAVLFFDGETFRLERLHRAVKRLRHVRLPGESAAAAATTAATTSTVTPVESYSPPIGKGAKLQSFNKSIAHPVPVRFLSE